MQQCQDCDGFIPPQLRDCPNCRVAPKRASKAVFKRAMQLLLGASVTMTLSACYGTPPPQPGLCDKDNNDSGQMCPPSPSPSADEKAASENTDTSEAN